MCFKNLPPVRTISKEFLFLWRTIHVQHMIRSPSKWHVWPMTLTFWKTRSLRTLTWVTCTFWVLSVLFVSCLMSRLSYVLSVSCVVCLMYCLSYLSPVLCHVCLMSCLSYLSPVSCVVCLMGCLSWACILTLDTVGLKLGSVTFNLPEGSSVLFLNPALRGSATPLYNAIYYQNQYKMERGPVPDFILPHSFSPFPQKTRHLKQETVFF